MSASKLQPVDIEISSRLRKAREEFLGLSQTVCAQQLGVVRTTWANYEAGRTPLRFDVALQFCRHFIISEEWLATGRCDAYHAALEAAGQAPMVDQTVKTQFDELFSVRQCVDLWNDPVSRKIRPGSPLSEVYPPVLAAKYAECVKRCPEYPVVRLTEADHSSTAIHYLQALHERHTFFLSSEAIRQKIDPSDLWRVYTMCAAQTGDLILRRLLGQRSSEEQLEKLEWLNCILEDASAKLPPLHEGTWSMPMRKDSALQSGVLLVNSLEVTPMLPKLLERLNSMTQDFGKKSELATHLGVARQMVSLWLSGKREPGGETTLRLLQWVQTEEAKQKSSDRARTQPEPRTQLRKSRETKPHPSPN